MNAAADPLAPRARIHLVADDSAEVRDLRGHLTELGYEIAGESARGDCTVGLAREPKPSLPELSAREEMEERRRINDAILRAVSQGVVIADAAGRIVAVNPAFVAITGYSTDEAIGRPGHFLRGPQTDPVTAAAIERALATATEFRGEVLHYRRDGQAFWNDFSLAPVCDEHGRLAHVVAVTRDITDRRRTDDALRASRDQVRALVQRLQEVREEERATISREMHDVMAQELARLKLDLGWLRRRLDPTWQSELAAKVASMTELADVTIASAQNFARHLRPVVLDSHGLGPAIEWLAQDCQRQTGLDCTVWLDAVLPPIEGRRATDLFRIVQECLTNVIRHAAARRVEISLAATPSELVLDVRDDGRGITEAERTDPKSIGLLGITERAALLGGTAEIASAAGGGTRVRVRVPTAPFPPRSPA